MIRLENIHFSYTDKPFIHAMDLHVKKGEILSIIGPNGSGKSTVLKNMARKLNFTEGLLHLDGENIQQMKAKEIATKMASLSQHQGSPSDFTVAQLIAYGRLPHKKWYESLSGEDKAEIHKAMVRTGVLGLSDKPITALSGGERQRVWIAMTLAQNPKVLLLDEPTTFLDICHQLEVLDLVEELNRDMGMTIVMVLHDLNQACQYSHRVCVMKEGDIHALGKPKEVFTTEMIRQVYNVEAKITVDEDGHTQVRPMRVCEKTCQGGCKAC